MRLGSLIPAPPRSSTVSTRVPVAIESFFFFSEDDTDVSGTYGADWKGVYSSARASVSCSTASCGVVRARSFTPRYPKLTSMSWFAGSARL